MAQVTEGLLKIRYRFEGESKFVTIQVTENQYQNLIEVPIVEECEIIR